jgi:catechol 2,3-dioxygenase-like lactoylglutathione lyase family enzyme
VADAEHRPALISLDFLYVPSGDVAADLAFYRDVLGGEIVFAIEAFDTRVAEVRVAPGSPHLLLAGHLEGEAPVLVHRVGDLDGAIARLAERGLEAGARFDIPPGPCAELGTPGGQRIGIYEATRPEVYERFPGRFDFDVPPFGAGDQKSL